MKKKGRDVWDSIVGYVRKYVTGGGDKTLQKQHLTVIGVAVVSLIVVFSVRYAVSNRLNTTYHGLGHSQTQVKCPYNRSLFELRDGRMTYSGRKYKAVQGIDVSAYQGKINWSSVSQDGIKFAMIRCGYRASTTGSIKQDKRFTENLIGAREAGLDTGIYFYSLAKTTDEAVDEAVFVLQAIEDYDVTYPIAFDLEESTGDMTTEERTDIANAFCSIIEQNGYKAMVYGNRRWLGHHFDMSYLTGYYTWLAEYNSSTDYKYDFRMWQYTNKGRVDGINTNVDRDVCLLKRY
ncbi:MAG: glycoside hydrolase family 25 protein [Anaerovoracaceae bacterium]|jgi:GH25 family lysozyme M1 (1,4-beta-N-acetylmuramidase)